jgi:hypothetical protein
MVCEYDSEDIVWNRYIPRKEDFIRAIKWDGQMYDFIVENPQNDPRLAGCYYIKTSQGFQSIRKGDYIIKRTFYERLPPEIFELEWKEWK